MAQRKHQARRIVALPLSLIERVLKVTPLRNGKSVNRIVRSALEEYVEHRRSRRFAEDMARMARDPDIRRENRKISREFRHAESDGLSDG